MTMLSNSIRNALRSGKLALAVAIARKSIREIPPTHDGVNDLLRAARMLSDAGAPNDAGKIWAEAARLSAGDYRSLRGLAENLLSHNMTTEAMPLLRAVCEMDEAVAEDLWAYHNVLRSGGSTPSETLVYSKKLTELDSENAGSWYTYARDQHQLGLQKDALASYARAVALAPESYRYLEYYAICLIESGYPSKALEVSWPTEASLEQRLRILWPVAQVFAREGYRKEAYESLQLLAKFKQGRALAAVDAALAKLRRDWKASLRRPDGLEDTYGEVVKTDRLLIVVDMSIMPYSIGELFYMFEAALCIQIEQGISQFDIAFVADAKSPARDDQQTNTYNYFEKLNALTQTAAFPRGVDSFFVFGDRGHFEKFLSENIDRYAMWPSLEDYFDRVFGYQKNFPYVNEFHTRHGFIPFLEPRHSLVDRMRKFLIEHRGDAIPVVVHLRVNKLHRDSRRNSNIPAWKGFFERCSREGVNAKFFVVTGTSEFFEPDVQELGALENVVLVKKHNTNVNEDFTLCMVGAAFLGGPSGPSVAAIFSDRPYVLFNYKKETHFHFIGTEPGQDYQFALKNQKLVWEPEYEELLYSEFAEIFGEIDTDRYLEELNSAPRAKNLNSMHILK